MAGPSLASLAGLLVLALVSLPAAAQAQRAVVVNGAALDAQTVGALERAYGAIQPGRYWYDPMSGLWGQERGPAAGQIAPGLRLGGPLRANASGGGTNVFINGRELHPVDVQRLAALVGGPVLPGRYWLNAAGIGGWEGGPPQFNLAAAAQQRGGGSWSRAGPFGHVGGSGDCGYYMDPKTGASVMTSGC